MHTFYFYFLKKDPKSLYALTPLKEYAKKFEEERNMDLFIKKKSSIDENEAMVLQFKQQSSLLQKDYLNDGNEDFEVLLTSHESTTLDECCTYIHSICDMIANRSHQYPLKSKYLKIIDEITSKITVSQDGTIPTFEVLNINTFRLFYSLFSSTFYKGDDKPENTF